MKIIALLFLLLACNVPRAAAAPPNVLFLFSDDQRADTIGALGNANARTPNLDKLVRAGTAFTRAYCMGSMHGAVCVPSRAMLMSGRTLFRVKESLEGVPMWPEQFAAAGYATFATGKWHNKPAAVTRGFAQGRALFFGGMTAPDKAVVQDISPERTLVNKRTVEKHSVEAFADAAVGFLASRKGEAQPFLCYCAFNAPHDPRVAPPAFHESTRANPPPAPADFLPVHPFNNGALTIRDELLAPFPRTVDVVRRHLADYYAAITFMDSQIGRILDALAASGHAENTIVVFASDHGLAIGSHGLFGKQNLYESGMRAPLIMAGPGIPAGQQRDAFAYLLDIFPTLGAMAGVSPPAGSEGLSLLPVLRGAEPRVRDAVFTAYANVQRAVRDERWKLIVYPQINKTQLFDLAADPNEMRDLAADPARAAEVERLMALLKMQQGQYGDTQVLRVAEPKPEAFDFTGIKNAPAE